MASTIHIEVDPGICGFCCRITAKQNRQSTRLSITDSACEHIQQLNTELGEINLRDLFLPFRSNPVIIAAEKAGCHLACPVPTALIKAAEAALGLALPKDVHIAMGWEE